MYETSTGGSAADAEEEERLYYPQYVDPLAQSVSNTFVDVLLERQTPPRIALRIAELGTFWTMEQRRQVLWASRLAAIALCLLGGALGITLVALSGNFWLLFGVGLWLTLVLVGYHLYWMWVATRELLKVRSFLSSPPVSG